MIPSIILVLSILAIAVGCYLLFGLAVSLIIVGVYLGVIAFAMAYQSIPMNRQGG